MHWPALSVFAAVLVWYCPAECARRVDASLRARETMDKRNQEDIKLLMRSSDEGADGGTGENSHVPRSVRNLEDDTAEDRSIHKRNVNTLLMLTKDEHLAPVAESKDATGTLLERLQEYYKDIPVYDGSVTVRVNRDSRLTGDASGTIVQDIDKDLPDLHANLTDEETLKIAIDMEEDTGKRNEITDVTFKKWVYLDDSDHARLVNIVGYLLDGSKRPHYIIDLKNGEVLKHWNAFSTIACGKREYKAYGGNKKRGRIRYGDIPFCLNMTIDHKTGTCFLENEYVRVIDMKTARYSTNRDAASFPCKNGYDDSVNDAYSPAVDAFFHATIVGKMFEDWLGATPLKEKQIIARVHFGDSYANAFWNGANCTFGDGNSMAYPLTTLDIVGHEIGHGTTEMSSGLIYAGESGGVNEAFSDIMGESAEQYLLSNDWFIGKNVHKSLPYLREFQRPENDNVSIRYARDMTEDLDSHYSSGVYRRVWYVLVKQKDMPVRESFHAFYRANKMYWHHLGSFYDCSCGVLRAAIDLGLSTTPFRRAFKDVGIKDCDVANHIFHLANNVTQHDVTVSDRMWPLFKFESPAWAENLLITAKSQSGKKIKIVVQSEAWEDLDEHKNDDNIVAEGCNDAVVNGVANTTMYIKLSSDELAADHKVNVRARYTCNDDYVHTSVLDRFMFKFYCYGEFPMYK